VQCPAGDLRILSYTAWYSVEDHETVALLQVEPVDGSAEPVWVRASVFVTDDEAYDALLAFARTRFRRCGNEHYPLLALAHTVHDKWSGRFECVIVAHDTSESFAMYTVCHKPSVGWDDIMDVSTDPTAADRVDLSEAALTAAPAEFFAWRRVALWLEAMRTMVLWMAARRPVAKRSMARCPAAVRATTVSL